MERRAAFDLTEQVQAWRGQLQEQHAFVPNNLDELESHLWDEIDACLASGATDGKVRLWNVPFS